MDTKKFIEEAKKIHGEKYNYKNTIIKHMYNDKVDIFCNGCNNTFSIVPYYHLKSKPPRGCYFCGISKRNQVASEISQKSKLNSLEEFIEKAKEIHGDKYEYDNVKFNKINDKVKIYCKKCKNTFEQMAKNHIRKVRPSGCHICGYNQKNISSVILPAINTIYFIEEANKVHDNKYYYFPDIDITSWHNKIKVNCYNHGNFNITPYDLIYKKSGCKECANIKRQISFEEFIKRCNEIHKNKYEYSDICWKGVDNNISVICDTDSHGSFKINGYRHQKGQGCPKCSIINIYKSEQEARKILENIFNNKFPKTQKILGNRLELDGYCKELNLAFEYQGIQHYEYHPHFHKNDICEFKAQQIRDAEKRKLCDEKSIMLIEIPYIYNRKNPDKMKKFILKKLKQIVVDDEIISIIDSYIENHVESLSSDEE